MLRFDHADTIYTLMTGSYIFPSIMIAVLILMRQSCLLSAVLKKQTFRCTNDLGAMKLSPPRTYSRFGLFRNLKLNQEKTELVVPIAPNFEIDQILNMFGMEITSLLLSRLYVAQEPSWTTVFAWNNTDVKKIYSEANYRLRNISKIRKYLTQDSA